MSNLVPPHGGGTLKPLLAPEAERSEELKRAATLKQVPMSSRETSDLVMMAMGAYTPLDGFMGEADWRGVCTDMKMAGGLFWPIPITLSAEQGLADSIGIEEEVALVDADSGEIMGVLEVTEKYVIDRDLECEHVYRTTDEKHPGVQKVLEQGPVNLAGRVTALSEGVYPEQ
ncbi:MAG: sulfate adenylyltransferase, partial [Pseudomonadota bacterium]